MAQNRSYNVPFINWHRQGHHGIPKAGPMRTRARFRSKKANRIKQKVLEWRRGSGACSLWRIFESAAHTLVRKKEGKLLRSIGADLTPLVNCASQHEREGSVLRVILGDGPKQCMANMAYDKESAALLVIGDAVKSLRNSVGHCGRKSRCCRCGQKYEQTQITSSANPERGTEKTKQP